MPRYQAPYNDEQRLTFLQRTLATGTQDTTTGNTYVKQDTLDAIAAFLTGFEAAVNAVNEQLGARVKETRERAAAIERVSRYVRDLWEGAKRRAHRLDQPAEVLRFYSLPLDGTTPRPTSQELSGVGFWSRGG